MRYQTPIEIATERAAKGLREDIGNGVPYGTAAQLMPTAQKAALRKLAQGIEASEYSCFIREDSTYHPLPSDHLLFAQVSAFLDNRGSPVCIVEKRVDLRGYRERMKRGQQVVFAGMPAYVGPGPDERDYRVEIMLEWQRDIYLEADDNGDPVPRAVPSDAAGDHTAESQSVVDLRVGFIEKLAAAFGVKGEVPDKVKRDLRNICCNHLAKEPFVFTTRTFDKAWGQAKNIRCHNPAGSKSPEK